MDVGGSRGRPSMAWAGQDVLAARGWNDLTSITAAVRVANARPPANGRYPRIQPIRSSGEQPGLRDICDQRLRSSPDPVAEPPNPIARSSPVLPMRPLHA